MQILWHTANHGGASEDGVAAHDVGGAAGLLQRDDITWRGLCTKLQVSMGLLWFNMVYYHFIGILTGLIWLKIVFTNGFNGCTMVLIWFYRDTNGFGWWLSPTPLKKYESVNWDDDIPKIWRNKNVPNHQPDHVQPTSRSFYSLQNGEMENWSQLGRCSTVTSSKLLHTQTYGCQWLDRLIQAAMLLISQFLTSTIRIMAFLGPNMSGPLNVRVSLSLNLWTFSCDFPRRPNSSAISRVGRNLSDTKNLTPKKIENSVSRM